VLLTGEYVYKIKKPVNFGFLIFHTGKRRFYAKKNCVLTDALRHSSTWPSSLFAEHPTHRILTVQEVRLNMP